MTQSDAPIKSRSGLCPGVIEYSSCRGDQRIQRYSKSRNVYTASPKFLQIPKGCKVTLYSTVHARGEKFGSSHSVAYSALGPRRLCTSKVLLKVAGIKVEDDFDVVEYIDNRIEEVLVHNQISAPREHVRWNTGALQTKLNHLEQEVKDEQLTIKTQNDVIQEQQQELKIQNSTLEKQQVNIKTQNHFIKKLNTVVEKLQRVSNTGTPDKSTCKVRLSSDKYKRNIKCEFEKIEPYAQFDRSGRAHFVVVFGSVEDEHRTHRGSIEGSPGFDGLEMVELQRDIKFDANEGNACSHPLVQSKNIELTPIRIRGYRNIWAFVTQLHANSREQVDDLLHECELGKANNKILKYQAPVNLYKPSKPGREQCCTLPKSCDFPTDCRGQKDENGVYKCSVVGDTKCHSMVKRNNVSVCDPDFQPLVYKQHEQAPLFYHYEVIGTDVFGKFNDPNDHLKSRRRTLLQAAGGSRGS
eukprot:g4495.t1